MTSPGLAFHEWVTSQGVTRKSSLDELRGAQLAIDADDYVDRILTEQTTREPLLPALGGFPIATEKHINAHLDTLKQLEITPRFVFNGLDVATKDRAAIAHDAQRTANSLAEAWNLYSLSQADAAVEEFGKSCAYRSHNVRRWLVHYLTKQGYHSFLAPYSAAAQIIYWKQRLGRYADAMLGGPALIVFGAEKIITAIDWEDNTFTWTTAELIRTKLGVSQDQLVDICLLSGLTLLSALPEIEDSRTNNLDAVKALLARSGNDVLTALMQIKAPPSYVNLYKRAKAVLKHVPVVQAQGQIDLENAQEAFGNIHDCIGRRMPEEVLYYSTRGLIDPHFLNFRTTMEVFEMAPLDGGTSQAYRQLIQSGLLPLRRQALAILSHRLHRYYHNQDVSLVCWFNEPTSTNLGLPEAIAGTSKAMDQWHVTDTTLDQLPTFDRASFDSSPLRVLITAVGEVDRAKLTKGPRTADKGVLKTASEFVANAAWRFLQGRGYINDSHSLTSWGKALKAAFDEADKNKYFTAAVNPGESEESIFLAIELVRLDVLNNTAMFTSPLYSGAPLRGTEVDKANTNLISRVASLGSFQHKEMGFTGPLSRYLLAYQQMTSATRTALRHLLEVYTVDMLLSGAFSRDIKPKQWSEYGARLPLVKEPNLGLALLVKSYLDELSHDRRTDITRWFPQAIDIHADLQTAWKLWAAVNAGVQAAEAVSANTKTMFSSADDWLNQKLKQAEAPLTNGTS